MLDLNELLLELVERKGSDLHITVGMPPVLRIDGKLVQTEGPRLTPADTKELIYAILKQDQREKLERETSRTPFLESRGFESTRTTSETVLEPPSGTSPSRSTRFRIWPFRRFSPTCAANQGASCW
jgi:hypothetical protein